MRIAWVGPAPSDGGGVSYAATQLVAGLVSLGHEVDCFYVLGEYPIAPQLDHAPGLTLTSRPLPLRDRLPGNATMRFVVGQTAKALAQRQLVRELVTRHRDSPYDVVYQFSQFELLSLRRLRRRLPPIVVHPEVHAAGELRWFVRERRLARFEPRLRRALVLAVLSGRALAQARDAARVVRVIAPSNVFAAHISRDYRVPPQRIGVVRNPIDLGRFTPASNPEAGNPVRLLFVSRLAVRKGLECIVDLSHRLDDLAGEVTIEIVGDKSQWSDYRPLLADLNHRVASYRGGSEPALVAAVYRGCSALLQPSHYEPFGLTVGEALASGLPVVASSEVGAVEGVDATCARVFPAGDLGAFERETRRVVEDLRRSRAAIAHAARAEAERLFSPAVVAQALESELAVATSMGSR